MILILIQAKLEYNNFKRIAAKLEPERDSDKKRLTEVTDRQFEVTKINYIKSKILSTNFPLCFYCFINYNYNYYFRQKKNMKISCMSFKLKLKALLLIKLRLTSNRKNMKIYVNSKY